MGGVMKKERTEKGLDRSLEEAGKVFRCLHGQWYRGQLVTAKYLRLERYHERFPDSQYSNQALTASRK